MREKMYDEKDEFEFLEDEVIDESETEVVPYKYSITAYGADYHVDGLVKRLQDESIYIPHFQREYVWTPKQAHRFIETLLLGLPVPSIFLSKELDTGKHIVIDGQQRLKTILFFYEGIFNEREFKLKSVQEKYEGKTYKTLTDEERRNLDDYLIHATIVKQDEPSDNQSSIYHIFERLNTGGTLLQPQEIRACIYYGKFNELLSKLNDNKDWRTIYGKPNRRMKDQELILRFFALYYGFDEYKRPMKEFLNDFMGKNRRLAIHGKEELIELFEKTISVISKAIGNKAFRPEKAINAAVFDAIMFAVAKKIQSKPDIDLGLLKEKYFELLKNAEFSGAFTGATADKPKVEKRINLAEEYFKSV